MAGDYDDEDYDDEPKVLGQSMAAHVHRTRAIDHNRAQSRFDVSHPYHGILQSEGNMHHMDLKHIHTAMDDLRRRMSKANDNILKMKELEEL